MKILDLIKSVGDYYSHKDELQININPKDIEYEDPMHQEIRMERLRNSCLTGIKYNDTIEEDFDPWVKEIEMEVLRNNFLTRGEVTEDYDYSETPYELEIRMMKLRNNLLKR